MKKVDSTTYALMNGYFLVFSLLIISAIGLTACGGGSSEVDTTPPVITLTGDALETVYVGSTYTDAGAIAIDDRDALVTVISSGTVDTSTAGTYVITYSATDTAGNIANDVTRTVTILVTQLPITGSEKFQVLDKKLVMKSVYDGDFLSTEVLTYGIVILQPDPDFVSLEGDLTLISNIITGLSARARVALEVTAKSASTSEFVQFIMSFESRFEGVVSRAFMVTAAEEVSIREIHNKTLIRGTETHFKVEFLNDGTNFVKLTIGENTALISIARLPASDMQFQAGSFNAYVEAPEVGNFVEGSVDNIFLKYNENGEVISISQDFSAYDDGTAPVADEYFNDVSAP